MHITRGALGLITSEAELAGVLAHEVGHVAHKHAVNAIRKGKAVQLGANETLSSRGPFLDKIANKAYDIVLENKFDRNDEMDSDKVSLTLAEKAGYAPGKLADFLTRLDERNKDQPASNGLFASHPDTQARIEAIRKQAGSRNGAVVEARLQSQRQIQADAGDRDRHRGGRRLGADRLRESRRQERRREEGRGAQEEASASAV